MNIQQHMAEYMIIEHVLEAKNKKDAIEKARDYNKQYTAAATKTRLPIKVHFLVDTVRSEPKGNRGHYKFNVRILKKSHDKNRLAYYEQVNGEPFTYDL